MIENEKHKELVDNFLQTCQMKRSINFNDVLKEAQNVLAETQSLTDLDSLDSFDKRDILETAIFNLEDKLEFVPIKNLLKEVDKYIEDDEAIKISQDDFCMQSKCL